MNEQQTLINLFQIEEYLYLRYFGAETMIVCIRTNLVVMCATLIH